MKTMFSKFTLAAIFTLALAFTVSCFEKSGKGNSTTAAITIDKRAIGTWEDENGKIHVVNPDGTGKSGHSDFKCAFFSDKVIMSSESESRYSSSNKTFVLDYVFSKDGKTLILYNPLGATWLTKKETEGSK
ncbi:MAG: hypothetical protein FWB90_01515 [Fibromonadales bacterium]|nr:hypothetical protein [Fibromonadales bacterium]